MEKNKKWKTECGAGDIDRFLKYFGIKWEEIPPEVRFFSFSNCEHFKEVTGIQHLIEYVEKNHDCGKMNGKIRITVDYDADFPIMVIRATER